VLYDTKDEAKHQVTSGFYDDDQPVFDPDGKYLYYRTKRWFDAIYSEFEPTWVYANSHALWRCRCARTWRRRSRRAMTRSRGRKPRRRNRRSRSPMTKWRRSRTGEGEAAGAGAEARGLHETRRSKTRREARPSRQEKKPKAVTIDLEGFEARAVVLPPRGGRFELVGAVPGKLVFTRKPRAGSNTSTSPMAFYDLEKREEKQILDDAPSVELTADGKKLLVARGRTYALLNVAENQPFAKPITPDLEATISPLAEWRQIFNDAWRIERDFFYDPHSAHGDVAATARALWQAARRRGDAQRREYILGELLGELNVSHAYRGGGDLDNAPGRNVATSAATSRSSRARIRSSASSSRRRGNTSCARPCASRGSR
jgi:tricorn protease